MNVDDIEKVNTQEEEKISTKNRMIPTTTTKKDSDAKKNEKKETKEPKTTKINEDKKTNKIEKAKIANTTTVTTTPEEKDNTNGEKDNEDDEMNTSVLSESSNYTEDDSDNTESDDDNSNKKYIKKEDEGKENDTTPTKKRKRRKTRNDISTNTPKKRKYTKRDNLNDSEIIKFPSLTSPGLLLNSNGIVTTPSYIFQESLDNSGYTEKYRIKNPLHKTSSYRKEVGDMFDCDVILHHSIDMDKVLMDTNFVTSDECDEFLNALQKCSEECKYQDLDNRIEFKDMVPISLMDYPQSYKDELALYTKRLLEREEIIAYNLTIMESNKKVKNKENETTSGANTTTESVTNDTTTETISSTAVEEDATSQTDTSLEKRKLKPVPPIPEPPSIPECYLNAIKTENNETTDDDNTLDNDTNNALSYKYTAHLDPACFHPTMRYYSLLSNNIADPHFVGPNAPMITSPNSNVGQHAYATINSTTGLANSSNDKTLATATPILSNANVPIKNLPLYTDKKIKANTPNAPECTRSISDLRKIMEESTEDQSTMQKFKECIILSSLDLAKQEEEKTLLNPNLNHKFSMHAANIVQHPFKGPDEEIYPDVIRAFALYSDLKPCKRCKNNKQGSFHCRMRRKHDGADWDGGGRSVEILKGVRKKYDLHSVDIVV